MFEKTNLIVLVIALAIFGALVALAYATNCEWLLVPAPFLGLLPMGVVTYLDERKARAYRS